VRSSEGAREWRARRVGPRLVLPVRVHQTGKPMRAFGRPGGRRDRRRRDILALQGRIPAGPCAMSRCPRAAERGNRRGRMGVPARLQGGRRSLCRRGHPAERGARPDRPRLGVPARVPAGTEGLRGGRCSGQCSPRLVRACVAVRQRLWATGRRVRRRRGSAWREAGSPRWKLDLQIRISPGWRWLRPNRGSRERAPRRAWGDLGVRSGIPAPRERLLAMRRPRAGSRRPWAHGPRTRPRRPGKLPESRAPTLGAARAGINRSRGGVHANGPRWAHATEERSMNQSATIRAVRRTVHTEDNRLKSTRMRLHLPRRRARDELRAWLPTEWIEDLDVAGPSPLPADEPRV